MDSKGLLALTDEGNKCVHLLTKEGALVRSIGKGVLGGSLPGIAFDQKGNVWLACAEWSNNKVVKLSQYGQHLLTIRHAGSEGRLSNPNGVSISPEGLMYNCDSGNHRVTAHDEKGEFLFAFGLLGDRPGCIDRPLDIAFGSDGLVYVTDIGNGRICVWSKEGIFERDFRPKYRPLAIAATSDNHLLITSHSSHTIMIYTVEGELVHEFGKKGSSVAAQAAPYAVHVDDSGLVYVVDRNKLCVQVF